MESVSAYLISVTAAALLCAIVTNLAGSGITGAVVRLTAGVIMALCVVSPWLNIRLDGLRELTLDISAEADEITADAENNARQEMERIISQQVRTYILDKAEELGVSISVDVQLEGQDIPVPSGICIRGAVSPYAKSVLSGYISDIFGIGSEGQTWVQS